MKKLVLASMLVLSASANAWDKTQMTAGWQVNPVGTPVVASSNYTAIATFDTGQVLVRDLTSDCSGSEGIETAVWKINGTAVNMQRVCYQNNYAYIAKSTQGKNFIISEFKKSLSVTMAKHTFSAKDFNKSVNESENLTESAL
ncbi:hypothetical protein P7245_22275 [Vibrio parahaemolyticus]|nr:hypothetical protein [Vibrio parahaemolyticus]